MYGKLDLGVVIRDACTYFVLGFPENTYFGSDHETLPRDRWDL